MVKEKIKEGYRKNNADISLIEIGGTVGDMENEYLIEAVRQLRQELGQENVVVVHLVYLPYLGASKELKTKPAQNSIRDLRARGIEPDMVVVRADKPIQDNIITKLSTMSGIEKKCVIPSATVNSIYEVPLNYHHHEVGETLLHKLQLPLHEFQLDEWKNLVDHIHSSHIEKNIALIGKYCDLEDAYYSLNEALKTAGYWEHTKIQLHFIDAESLNPNTIQDQLSKYDGICIP